MHYLDLIVGVLTTPVTALQKITAEPRPGVALAVHTVTALTSILAGSYAVPSVSAALPVLFSVAAGLIFVPLSALLFTAVLHLTAEFLGGQGRALSLFSGLAFASVPSVLMAPFGLAMRAAPPSFYYLVAAAISLWVLILQVLAIQTCYGFSAWRALATLFLPAFTVLAAVLVGIILGVAAIVPKFAELLSAL